MFNRVPPGVVCAWCHIGFGSHELSKTEGGLWFHQDAPFKSCYSKWKQRQPPETYEPFRPQPSNH